MGQAESVVSVVQKSLDANAGKPSQFIEDMTAEDRANYYKTVLKVNSRGSSESGSCEHGKHLLS